jgi:hypothetical protein
LPSSFLFKYIKVKIHITITVPYVLYGFETLSLTWREEQWLKVLADRVLRKIFGPTRDEVTGKWTRLNIEELYELYYSLNAE